MARSWRVVRHAVNHDRQPLNGHFCRRHCRSQQAGHNFYKTNTSTSEQASCQLQATGRPSNRIHARLMLHCSRRLFWMIERAFKLAKAAKFASDEAQTAARCARVRRSRVRRSPEQGPRGAGMRPGSGCRRTGKNAGLRAPTRSHPQGAPVPRSGAYTS